MSSVSRPAFQFLSALLCGLGLWFGCSTVPLLELGTEGSAAAGSRGAEAKSARPDDTRPGALTDGARLHFLGVWGDTQAAQEALERFESLAQQGPDDPVVLAYLGSAQLLEATRLFLPWKKGDACRRGLTTIDRAVGLAPENLEVRFLRATSTYALPSFCGRVEESRADLDWLGERWEHGLQEGKITRGMAAALLFKLGNSLRDRERLESARTAWRRAAQVAPRSEPGRRASDALASH